jgi:chemotaxis protein MotB
MLARVRSLVSVGGRSWSTPIYNDDGTVNADASRRVEIKFRLSDEEMINQLLDVLGQYE